MQTRPAEMVEQFTASSSQVLGQQACASALSLGSCLTGLLLIKNLTVRIQKRTISEVSYQIGRKPLLKPLRL